MIFHIQCGRTCLLAILTLVCAAISSQGAVAATKTPVKRVLIIDSFGRYIAPFNAVSAAFRTTLAKEFTGYVDIDEAPFDAARFTEARQERLFADFLQRRFAGRKLDLVVPISFPAASFAVRYRKQLFAEIPLLLTAVEQRRLPAHFLTRQTAAVPTTVNLTVPIDSILQLLPETKNIVVVMGASALEKFWLSAFRQEIKKFANRVKFTWYHELSFDEMKHRAATLPPHSAIFYGLMIVDAAGIHRENDEALESLRAVANAPIFGLFGNQLGMGAVGGRLLANQEVGVAAARVALRILGGEVPSGIPIKPVELSAPVYDWRELQRWKIAEARLPPGAAVRFREPTFWQRHQTGILLASGLFILQAGIIGWLLTERRRRRAAQLNLRDRLQFEEFVAELSARFIRLPPQQIDDQIVESLRTVGELLGFDQASLAIFSGPATGKLQFVWQRPGTPPMPQNLTDRDFPWISKQLLAGHVVSVLSPKELGPEAEVDRATNERVHVCSVHSVPLFAGETVVGALSVTTFFREQGITAELLQRQRLLGEVFANALARQQADEALRTSEEQIGLAAESANLGVWNWDITHDSLWATEKCRALHGFSPEQAICFQTFVDALHEGDRERVKLTVEGALRDGKDFAEEYRVVLPGGIVRWISSFGRGHFNSADLPLQMLGVSIDLTSRKRMEETLGQEREFLRQVIDADPNFIFAKDRQGRFTLANRAVADAYGTTVEDLVGKSDAEFNANLEEVEFFRRLDEEVIETKRERFIPEEQLTDAKGNVRWLQTVKRPIFLSDGQVNQVLGSATDITRRREAEFEATRQRDELAHVTRNATMGELAASLAHELNQPLTAILSNAQAAQRFLAVRPVNLDEVREILKDIVDDNMRASDVIRKMRALVKKEKLALAPTDLATVIRDAVALVHGDAVLRNIEVGQKIGGRPIWVYGDKVHLQQVLLNLFLNAFDAVKGLPVGARQVSATIESDDPGLVKVGVSDNGRGLTGAMLDKIFEPFFTTKREGLGMGLCISRSIVGAHGGRLWAENNDGPGATFYFTVPVVNDGTIANVHD